MPSVNMEFGTASNFTQLSADEVKFHNFVPKAPYVNHLWTGDLVLCQSAREFRRYDAQGTLIQVVTFEEVGK